MSVVYFEHYPHYMGTMNSTIKFTDKQFNTLITLAKAAVAKIESQHIEDDF